MQLDDVLSCIGVGALATSAFFWLWDDDRDDGFLSLILAASLFFLVDVMEGSLFAVLDICLLVFAVDRRFPRKTGPADEQTTKPIE
jgi:hypothetical protein